MGTKYKIINGDGHIDLNPDVWRDRVASKFRDRAPKKVTMPNGADAVVVDGGKPNTIGITRSVGVDRKELANQIPTFANSAGTGSPQQRVQEQDRDGVEAEILFSQLSAVFRQAKDDDLYRDLFRAYNEYLAEEYQAAAPDRLFPMGILPNTGIDDALAELKHCKDVGLRGIQLTAFPSGKSRPTPEDDKFWAAALEMGMPISNHTDGKLGRDGGPSLDFPKEPGSDVHQRDPLRFFFRFTNDAMRAVTQMAFAGVWDRFPELEIYWAETQVGWMPYGLWQIDDHYDRYMPMIHDSWGIPMLKRKPSEYMVDRNIWGFLHDKPGVQQRHTIGVDKIAWGSDFAHAASDWPNSQKIIKEDFEGVPEDERYAILAGNMVRFYGLETA